MESPYSTDFLLDASFDSTASRFNELKDNNFNTEFRLFESLKMSDEYDDAPLEADYSEREVLEEKDVDDGQFAPASPVQRDSRIATPTSPARTPSAEPPASPVPTYERRVESPIEVVAPAPQIDEYKDKENDDYKAGRPKIGWAPVEEPRSPPQTENDSKAVVKEKSVKNLIARFNTGEAFQSNASSSGDYKKDYGVAGGTGSVNKGIFQ